MSRGVLEPSYRKRVGYQAMLLGGMATLASALLVLGDLNTREDIAMRHAEDLKESLSQVIPPAMHDNDLLADTLKIEVDGGEKTFYRARSEGLVNGVAFESVGYGYSGAINIMMAVDADGEVLGVRVLQHAETPGLGDKIEIAKDDWITSFNGRSLENTTTKEWHVKKDGGLFDQFTGATITPRAVVKAVHQGLEQFNNHRIEILTAESAQSEHATEE